MKNKYSDKLEETLKGLLLTLPKEASLQESAGYMLLDQGKRIRPSICLSILEDFKKLEEQHYFISLSIEILHTASLIHDDLPAIDNDDFRRGKPSCHKRYSEAQAILLGDYLQTWALNIISQNVTVGQLSQLIAILTDAYQNVCLGQMLDMEDTSAKDFGLINKLKTATLFASAFEAAGLLSELEADGVQKLKKIGEDFGLVFQLINDFKDTFLSPESTGRRDSSDSKNNKKTAINEFSNVSDAKTFLDQQINIWNNDFKQLKVDLNNDFNNLSAVVEPVLYTIYV